MDLIKHKNDLYLLLGSVAYSLLTIFCLTKGFQAILLIPVLLLFFWAISAGLNQTILLTTLFVPLSLNIENIGSSGFSLHCPTEPIIGLISIVLIFNLIYKPKINKDIIFHPINIIIACYLIWTGITIIPSTMPLVSGKYLISKLWYIIPFYFIGIRIFKDTTNIYKFFCLYLISLTIVIAYTLERHYSNGFSIEAGYFVMSPFFKDHTSYGASIAMFLPALFIFIVKARINHLFRIISILVFIVLVLGFIFSYTRAAWISIGGVIFIFAIMQMKIKFNHFLIILTIGFASIWAWQNMMISKLETTNQSKHTFIEKHLHSIYNITSDDSNLERINRWDCAWQLFKERPIFGWGPGVYQFEYGVFQNAERITAISTNLGDRGNAHSEFLGALSEQGVFGFIIYLALLIYVSKKCFYLFYNLSNKDLKWMVLGIYLGLATYYIHGFLNNFLNADKISVPFWAFTAMIVSIDIAYKKSINAPLKSQIP